MHKLISVAVLLLVLALGWSPATAQFRELYTWKTLDWRFPNDSIRNEALQTGQFIRQNTIPAGIVQWGNRVFISVPRWRDGIPATLNSVRLNKGANSTSPRLNPYPDWTWHMNQERCENKLFSVVRLAVDNKGRLWIADNGGAVSNNTFCRPKLVIFDLNTDRTVLYEYFPSSVISADNYHIINVALDYSEKDDRMFAYFVDLPTYSIIVYDEQANRFWRVNHNYLYPDPLSGDYNINGVRFQEMFGVFSVAVSPLRNNGEQYLYINVMASYRLFAVPTSVLKNETLSGSSFDKFYYTGAEKKSQSTVIAMNKNGVLFYPLLSPSSIACWNWNKPFRADTQLEIARNPITLEFVADMKVIGDDLWVISNRYNRFNNEVMDWSDTNYRILTMPIQNAITDTVCE